MMVSTTCRNVSAGQNACFHYVCNVCVCLIVLTNLLVHFLKQVLYTVLWPQTTLLVSMKFLGFSDTYLDNHVIVC